MSANVDSDSLLLIGRAWKAHGIRGEVKVIPETDDPERLADLKIVFTGKTPDRATPGEIESIRFQPTKKGVLVVLKLASITTREEADALRKQFVFAREEDLPPLEDDEFFLHDLVGLAVVTDAGQPIGRIEDVLELPAQELLIIRRDDGRSTMVPAVPEFIVNIDFAIERVTIRPIEGLLE